MTSNLNEKLYSRFGIKVQSSKVQLGFKIFLKNTLLNSLDLLVSPDGYKDSIKLCEIQGEVLQTICHQIFLDEEDYDDEYGFGRLIKETFSEKCGDFNELLVRLQILFNILYGYPFICFEYNQALSVIKDYIDDYPILGVKIKIYKGKPPQLYPSVSKIFDDSVDNVLGLLEDSKLKNVLDSFEVGLAGFIQAKSQPQLKDVIEDMSSSCDEMVKVIFNDKNKGFKHVFEKEEYKKFGLSNKIIKEIFRNLKDWMDNIKHGSVKDFTRDDVETIIILTAQFLRHSVNAKHL